MKFIKRKCSKCERKYTVREDVQTIEPCPYCNSTAQKTLK